MEWGEELEKAINELLRDKEVMQQYQKLAGMLRNDRPEWCEMPTGPDPLPAG